MLLLDSEALSTVAHGPASRRDRVRALIVEMRRRELPIATVATVLAEVVRGRAADAGVFAGLRRERVMVYPVDTRVGVRAGQLLGRETKMSTYSESSDALVNRSAGPNRSLNASPRSCAAATSCRRIGTYTSQQASTACFAWAAAVIASTVSRIQGQRLLRA